MKIFNLRDSSFININSASCCYDERRQSRTFWATYVCNLVFGADDSVLREFTELHVVIVCKGVSEGEKDTSTPRRPQSTPQGVYAVHTQVCKIKSGA